jgi:hypothetical protein
MNRIFCFTLLLVCSLPSLLTGADVGESALSGVSKMRENLLALSKVSNLHATCSYKLGESTIPSVLSGSIIAETDYLYIENQGVRANVRYIKGLDNAQYTFIYDGEQSAEIAGDTMTLISGLNEDHIFTSPASAYLEPYAFIFESPVSQSKSINDLRVALLDAALLSRFVLVPQEAQVGGNGVVVNYVNPSYPEIEHRLTFSTDGLKRVETIGGDEDGKVLEVTKYEEFADPSTGARIRYPVEFVVTKLFPSADGESDFAVAQVNAHLELANVDFDKKDFLIDPSAYREVYDLTAGNLILND